MSGVGSTADLKETLNNGRALVQQPGDSHN